MLAGLIELGMNGLIYVLRSLEEIGWELILGNLLSLSLCILFGEREIIGCLEVRSNLKRLLCMILLIWLGVDLCL